MGLTLIEFHRQKYVCLLVFHSWSYGQTQMVPDSLFLDSWRVTCHNYDSIASFLCLNLFLLYVLSVGKDNWAEKLEIVICPKLAEKCYGLRSKFLAKCGFTFTIDKLVGRKNILNILICMLDAKKNVFQYYYDKTK